MELALLDFSWQVSNMLTDIFTLCSYLGLLHMEVFHQRLNQEYGANIITTIPTVPYTLQHTDGSTEDIQNPSQVSTSLACPDGTHVQLYSACHAAQ